MTKTNYKTKWHSEILKYFQALPNEHATAADVYDYFKAQGHTIGMATVYRQLDHLVSDGILNKYTIEPGSPSCYEYAKYPDDDQIPSCFHCKCEICGKLIHLHCSELALIQGHLSKAHNFTLNPLRTVFYGLCDTCRQEAEQETIKGK